MSTIFNATLYKVDEHQIVVIDGAEYLLVVEEPKRRSNYTSPYFNQPTMNDIIVATKGESEALLQSISKIVNEYSALTLADLYDLLGLQTSHTDNKWGWTSLETIEVRQVREGYLLDFPALEQLP